jgi:hypothetical protein
LAGAGFFGGVLQKDAIAASGMTGTTLSDFAAGDGIDVGGGAMAGIVVEGDAVVVAIDAELAGDGLGSEIAYATPVEPARKTPTPAADTMIRQSGGTKRRSLICSTRPP